MKHGPKAFYIGIVKYKEKYYTHNQKIYYIGGEQGTQHECYGLNNSGALITFRNCAVYDGPHVARAE